MASNVIKTYASSTLRTRCQEWVDNNPDKTQAEIAHGLLTVFNTATDVDLGKFSKHLAGQAFDVQRLVKTLRLSKKPFAASQD